MVLEKGTGTMVELHIRAECADQQLATQHMTLYCVGRGSAEAAGGSLGHHSEDPVLEFSREVKCFRYRAKQ